jgi:hypothetical protein
MRISPSIVVMAALVVVSVSVRAEAQYSSPVRDVENPARSMFIVTADVDLDSGAFFTPFTTAFIPAGKRLTLEFISANCSAPAEQNLQLFIQLRQPGGSFSRAVRIPMTSLPVPLLPDSLEWMAGQLVRLYADYHPGGSAQLAIARNGNGTGAVRCDVHLSGHTVAAQ